MTTQVINGYHDDSAGSQIHYYIESVNRAVGVVVSSFLLVTLVVPDTTNSTVAFISSTCSLYLYLY
jgi:hypothetical protein